METIYLRNGEEALLLKKIDDESFIIEKIMTYCGYKGEEWSEPSGSQELVGEIFKKPPIEKKQDEFAKLLNKIEVRNTELSLLVSRVFEAENKIRQLEKTKTDLSKNIINRSELLTAKSITVFSNYQAYTITETEEKRSLHLSSSINIWEGKMEAWIYELDWEGRKGYSNRVNPQYGLLIDATNEEIIDIGKEIVRESKEISDWDLRNRISEEYLTGELKERKKELEKEYTKNDIEKLEKEIKEKRSKIKELKLK